MHSLGLLALAGAANDHEEEEKVSASEHSGVSSASGSGGGVRVGDDPLGSGCFNRGTFNAEIPTRDLVEYYWPVWQTIIKDAAIPSIMCSHNAVNGADTSFSCRSILRPECFAKTGSGQT